MTRYPKNEKTRKWTPLELKGKIKDIYCVYVVREKGKTYDTIKLWAYTFKNPLDITSIKFIKSCSYKLINQN